PGWELAALPRHVALALGRLALDVAGDEQVRVGPAVLEPRPGPQFPCRLEAHPPWIDEPQGAEVDVALLGTLLLDLLLKHAQRDARPDVLVVVVEPGFRVRRDDPGPPDRRGLALRQVELDVPGRDRPLEPLLEGLQVVRLRLRGVDVEDRRLRRLALR